MKIKTEIKLCLARYVFEFFSPYWNTSLVYFNFHGAVIQVVSKICKIRCIYLVIVVGGLLCVFGFDKI